MILRRSIYTLLLAAVCEGIVLKPTRYAPSVAQEMFEHNVWSGMDIFDEADDADDADSAPASEDSVSKPSRHDKLGVQILGLQDSGTNLLYSMLRQNFQGKLVFYTGKGKTWADRGIWKHVNLMEKFNNEPEKFQPIRDGRVIALAMVRDPLSWLQSVRKAPYELKGCTVGDDWLMRNCTHPIPAGYPDVEPDDAPAGIEKIRRVVAAKTYSSLTEVWNQWTNNYDNFTQFGFADGMTISYEELVLHPKQTLRKIATRFNLHTPRNIAIKEDAAKDHGAAICRGEAIRKISQRTYLSSFMRGQRWEACSALGKDLMHKYGYRDCDCCRTPSQI